MRFFIQTFGCKSNQYETQALREDLVDAGFDESPDAAGADLYILNSCAVTTRAGASCRNAYRKALRENPRLRTVITGCAVDVEEPWLADLGCGLVVPNAKKHGLAELLLATWPDAGMVGKVADDRLALSINRFHGHTRAFIKIQDGCDNHCSYCVVPLARGRPQSRPPADILREAERLVRNGHPELALTGINIGAYNHDGLDLAGLIVRLAETPGLARLRLGSIEPQEVTPALISALRGHGKICSHLHLPLQSGDDGVLAAMRRRYRAEEFLETVERIKSSLDNPAISTDVIVGFPGEDERAFENTYATCQKAGFARLHVFLFSPRPGTPAAVMKHTAHDHEIEQWKNRLLVLADSEAERYARSCVGLLERAIGETGPALTDRYLRVYIKDRVLAPGESAIVRITGSTGPDLEGESVTQ